MLFSGTNAHEQLVGKTSCAWHHPGAMSQKRVPGWLVLLIRPGDQQVALSSLTGARN